MTSLFTRRVDWSTWEFGLAKVGFILFGIIIGATWPEVFRPLLLLLAVVGVAALVWPTYLWFRGPARPARPTPP
jgi:hypothetical protein